MRSLRLIPLLVVACTAVGPASAQQPGDKVVTITDRELRTIRLMMDARESIPRGTIFVVQKVEGDRLWVSRFEKAPGAEGWLDRSHVISFPAALDFFNNEVKRNPTAQAYAIRGKLWHEKHELEKALTDWNEAIRCDPNDPLAYVERGAAWFDEKEYEKAIADCNEAILLDPSCGMAYALRGSVWWAKEEYDRAIPDYVEALRFDPEHAFDSIHRGRVWNDKAHYDEARFNYDKATHMKPRTGIFVIIRTPLPFSKEDSNARIVQDTNAIRINAKNVKAYISRAESFIELLQYDEAIADYEAAIRLDAANFDAWNGVAWITATCIKSRSRDGKKAVQYAIQACELTGWKDWRSLDTLAVAHAEVGDFTSAVKWETQALQTLASVTKVHMRPFYEREFRSRLELFKAHKPYHEEAKK
jgi:tetratricopeptide (TPR) repeat protein